MKMPKFRMKLIRTQEKNLKLKSVVAIVKMK